MLLTKEVEIGFNGKYIKYYKNKEYDYPKIRNDKGNLVYDKTAKIKVKVKDLPKNSGVKVKVLCDYCGENTNIKSYQKYNKQREIIDKDCCSECQRIKFKESMIEKYGVECWQQTDEGRKFSGDFHRKHTINECKKIFKKRGYDLLEEKYKNNDTHMKYICSKHKDKGVQKITLGKILTGRGCKYCAIEARAKKQSHSFSYIKKYIENGSSCKLISNEYTNIKDKNLKIQCKCGNVFTTSFGLFRISSKRCKTCSQSISKSEYIIKKYLEDKNIKFKYQKSLHGCKNINRLPFDFLIFDKNNNLLFCLEYDGEHHFQPVQFGGMSYSKAETNLKNTKIRDEIKTQYCKDNNIPLVRIPYWQQTKIEKILYKWLSKYRLLSNAIKSA